MRACVSAGADSRAGTTFWSRVLCLATLVAVVGAAPLVEAAAPPGEWWSGSYLYRQKVVLSAGAAVPAQYSITAQLDHATLVALNQSLASGDDLRVVYWNGTAWVELDRRLDEQSSWNSATTTIWFRTQAAIGAGLTDDNYYLYYGNGSAGAPPANWANVFLFHDDFNDGVFDGTRWICADVFGSTPPPVCAEAAAAPGTLSLMDDTAVYATPAYAIGMETRWEGRLRLTSATAPTWAVNYFGASDMVNPINPYQKDWITFWMDTTQHVLDTADEGVVTTQIAPAAVVSPTSYHVYAFEWTSAVGVEYFQDGGSLGIIGAGIAANDPLRVLVWNDDNNNPGIILDWVRVRQYVSPEPTAALEAPQGESVCEAGNQMWWDADWGRRRKITFNNSAQTEDLDNFPVLIRLDSTRVDYTRTQNSGQDIRFVDTDHETVLDHEIEEWNETGSSFVWVRVPRIPGASRGDFIWMYYDHGTVGDGQNATGVWDTSYRGVWHLKEPAAGPFVDSTTNPNDGTVAASPPLLVPGQIDGALGFDTGTDRHISVSDHTSLQLASSLTVSAWVSTNNSDGQNRVILAKWGNNPGVDRNYWLGKLGTNFLAFIVDDVQSVQAPMAAINDGAWHHVVGVADPGPPGCAAQPGCLRLFVDGSEVATAGYTGTSQTGSPPLFFSENPGSSLQFWDGNIDEPRVEAGPRSADWIAAQHLSMTDAFASFSAEVGRCNLRSIGTAGPYGSFSVAVTNGSRLVTGAGTAWQVANRGRGDRININGVDYVVYRVVSDTQLLLASVYRGGDAPNHPYTIARQFRGAGSAWQALVDWEDCIDGSGNGGTCAPFPEVTGDFVADNRGEIGIAYDDTEFDFAANFEIEDSTTDAVHTITLTADGINRHNGVPNGGLRFDGQGNGSEVLIQDANVTLEGLELGRFFGADNRAAIRVLDGGAKNVLLQNLLIHTFYDGPGGNDVSGIRLSGGPGKSVTVRNTMIWAGDEQGIEGDEAGDSLLIENCTIDNMFDGGASGIQTQATPVTVRNTIVTRSGISFAPGSGGFTAVSDNNIDYVDGSAPGAASQTVLLADIPNLYVLAGNDLHLRASATWAIDQAADLSAGFSNDIDGEIRPGGAAWDIGADEFEGTTVVELLSFAAVGSDSAVGLSWRTGSELNNLGFHLHRSLSKAGPWTRITPALIPGLGSSPEGASYSFRDTGLTNGVLYFYRLEDIDSESGSTFHGPVSAVPGTAPPAEDEEEEPSDPESDDSGSDPEGEPPADSSVDGESRTYGRPEAASFRVVSRTKRAMVVELRTPGFVATETPSGLQISVPGFDQSTDSRAPDLPLKRVVLDGLVGRHARIVQVKERRTRSFPGLTPAAVGDPEIVSSPDGTVRPRRRSAALRADGLVPRVAARIPGDAFIGETKKLALEMSPLRYDTATGELRLARRLRVKIAFDRKAASSETGHGSRGRRRPRFLRRQTTGVLAHLHTQTRGLHAVSFESLFPQGHEAVALESLRLSRQGESVPFHVEPQKRPFGPGSVLYFHASREAASMDYSSEVAYALEQTTGGVQMPLVSAKLRKLQTLSSAPLAQDSFETDRFYQAGLLEAPDIWLWDFVVGGTSKSFPLVIEGLDPTSALPAHLQVVFQGASEADTQGEHHLSVSLNGTPLGETSFDGKLAHVFSTSVPASVLLEGENSLTITNLGDTGAYSFVFLDRVDLVYPQVPALRSGLFSGVFSETGRAVVSGEAQVGLDVTDPDSPVWLQGLRRKAGTVRFKAEAGHRYVLASGDGLLAPRVSTPLRSTLRSTRNQADYVLIAPEAFLEAAQPLLERRQDQGLTTKAVSFEQIASEFGHGRPSAQAIRDVLAYAYHSWQQPSLRYVLLLGDSSYDPRNFTGFDQGAPLPAMWAKTSYLWTSSDPTFGAVNGEDLLPDVAIGRLPAKTLAEAHALVQKVLAWEDSAQDLSGTAVLVADNPDLAGDFEADVLDIKASFLGGRPTKTLFLRQLGGATRPEILASFDEGASLMSYVGHGGAAVWASENVLNSWDTASLRDQSRQPLMLTFNCLNGYFLAPNYDSLSEAFVKVEGRGAIGAFSPSGLSLDGPAHRFHRALMAEITGGTHERLGDAVLAAQAAYAETGVMPELLAIYHLLADPGMKVR
jgi:hypothetical protein